MNQNSWLSFTYRIHEICSRKVNTPSRVSHTQSATLLKLGVITLLCWMLPGCSNSVSPTGTSVTWDTQVSVALQAAAKVDKSARLWSITAYPAEYRTERWDYATSSLKLEFAFIEGVSGKDITIRFQDTAIDATLEVETKPALLVKRVATPITTSVPTTAQTPLSLLAIVRLGPREAGLLTWDDARAQAAQRGIKISPGFYLEVLKPRVRWQIDYDSSSRKTLGYDLLYIVDARTGEILERNYTPSDFSEP